MASEINPSTLRGLLIRDSRFSLANVDTTNSSLQQASAEPGPVAKDAAGGGAMRLDAVGELTSDAAYNLRISAKKSGAPVGGDPGGRFTWRNNTDAAGARRGYLEPNKVTGWEHAAYHATDDYTRPHAVTTPEHKVICVFSDDTNSAVKCVVLDPETDAWAAAVVVDAAVPGPACVVLLPGGRIVCVYVRDDLTEAGVSYWTLGQAYSDDDGATWTKGAAHVAGFFVAQSAETPRRIRAVYHETFITAIVETFDVGTPSDINTYHLVSDDLGASWSEIERLDASGSVDNWSYDLFVKDGQVVMVYQQYSTTHKIYYVRKTSPRSTLSTEPSLATYLSIEAGSAVSEALAVVLLDDGLWVYFLGAYASERYQLGVARRDPDAMTAARTQWISSRDSAGNDVLNWPADFGGDLNETIDQFCATPYKGGVLLLHNPFVNAALTNRVAALHLGGYSSLDWRVQTFGSHRRLAGALANGKLFLGSHAPATIADWTVAGAGTPSNVLGGFSIVTAANSYSAYRTGPTGSDSANPIIVWARVRVASGGSLGADVVAIRVVRANNTFEYDVSLRLTDTSARLWDNDSGTAAQIGADVTGLSVAYRDWLVVVGGSTVAVFYKLPTETKWTAGPTGTMGDDGAGVTANRVDWGHIDGGTGSSVWAFVASSLDYQATAHGLQAFTNPTDLQGRAFSTSPQWIGDQEGIQVQARGGAVLTGDAWTATSRAAYGYQNAHPEIAPSPDIEWRTPIAAATQTLIWTPNGGSATRLLSSSIGLYVAKANMRTLYLEGKTTGSGTPGTWTTLITLDQHATIATNTLTADVNGDWIRPNSATLAGARWIEGGELIGGHVILTWTGGGGGSAGFEILDNTEGVWRDPNLSRAVEIRVDGDTSAATGTITAVILPPASVGVAHGVTSSYEAYRLRIPGSQTTTTSDYRLGVVVVGPLLIWGEQYDHGRVVADEGIIEEYESGGRITRRDVNRPRRSVTVAWTKGTDTTQAYATSTPDPDFLAARGAASYDGIAARADPATLSGLLRRLRGSQPVVYLPRLVAATGAAPSDDLYSGPEYVYGWPSPLATRTSRLGDELSSEVVTWDALTITEIL